MAGTSDLGPYCSPCLWLLWGPVLGSIQPECACTRAIRSRPPRLWGTPQVCAPACPAPTRLPCSLPQASFLHLLVQPHHTVGFFLQMPWGLALSCCLPPRPGDLSSCRAVSGCPLLGKSFGSPSLPHSLHLSAAVLMPFPNPSRLHGSCSHGRRRGSELRTWWSLNRHFLKKSRKGSFGVGRKPLV